MGANLSFLHIDPKVVEKISGIVDRKGVPLIYSQNPPPGTPIPKGMQVQVVTFQPGDVTLGVLDDRAHIALAEVPYEELIKLYATDEFFGSLKGKNVLPPDKKEQFVNEINAKLRGKGIRGEISVNDADLVFDSIKDAGNVGVNRRATVDVTRSSNLERDVGGITGGFVNG
jgi:hypothetical protein